MATLWELVSEKLEFRSLTSKWGNASSVTTPGSHMLQNNDPLPDRCVYDGNLLDALEDAVKNALHPIHADPALTTDLETLQRWYDPRPDQGVDLSSENMVCTGQRHIEKFRFASADTTQHQRPDIRGQLTPVGVDVAPVNISIIELESEGIVRKFWEAIVNRVREEVRLNWDGRARWDMVDSILLQVTTYLVSYNMTWLCWAAASHLIHRILWVFLYSLWFEYVSTVERLNTPDRTRIRLNVGTWASGSHPESPTSQALITDRSSNTP
ncbi:hypothetical protein JB92DRAFT_3149370 [Gautieria morchelliformis]|nr:hypothetical protein JB92DRAFT_3149370 [Gautieria morchelliformis]